MRLQDLRDVEELKEELRGADLTVEAFEKDDADVVRCFAQSGLFGREREVELLPVQRSLAISAAQRERSKIVDKLAQLGVTVD